MLKLRLKLAPALTVGEPTDWPLKVTSTVSPGWNAAPLTVIVAPTKPDDVDNPSEAAGRAVAVDAGVAAVAAGAGVPVVWPSAGNGTISRATSTMSDAIAPARTGRSSGGIWCRKITKSP